MKERRLHVLDGTGQRVWRDQCVVLVNRINHRNADLAYRSSHVNNETNACVATIKLYPSRAESSIIGLCDYHHVV
jgi:hypothetical protein